MRNLLARTAPLSAAVVSAYGGRGTTGTTTAIHIVSRPPHFDLFSTNKLP
ncbi:MAG: hypothetical protein HG447_003140 [Prevotella sp.]|nr:hypothetical protein [Prevotella sp.]